MPRRDGLCEQNSGPDLGTAISPAISPKVIGVGAVTKDATLVAGSINVTAPEPVPANLKDFPFGGAAFGPSATSTVGPAPIVPVENVSTAATDKSLGCSLAADASPYPRVSAGSIALVRRMPPQREGVQRATGAIATFVYNNTANENRRDDGRRRACSRTIPSWLLGRTNGLNVVAWANANPTTARAKFDPAPHVIPSARRRDGRLQLARAEHGQADQARRLCSRRKRLLERLRQRPLPGPVHGLRPGLGNEHGDPARRGLGRAAQATPSNLDAGTDQVGADDDRDRERVDDDGEDDARGRARPRRGPDRPDEGGHSGPHPGCAQPERR